MARADEAVQHGQAGRAGGAGGDAGAGGDIERRLHARPREQRARSRCSSGRAAGVEAKRARGGGHGTPLQAPSGSRRDNASEVFPWLDSIF